MRPELDNHWALRDFASRLMAQICKNFNTSTNNIQTRVTRMFSRALQSEKSPLSSLYGAIEGLSELGPEVIKVFIMPKVKYIADRIEPYLEYNSVGPAEKIAAGHIKLILVKVLAPIIKTTRFPPVFVKDYKTEYGCLGSALQNAVIKGRTQSPPTSTTPTTITGVVNTYSRTQSTPTAIVQQAPTSNRTIVMTNPTNRVPQSAQNQKIVFLTQRPQTPNVAHQVAPQTPVQQTTVMKFVTSAPTAQTQKVVTTTSKLVVACSANTAPTVSQVQASGNQPPISVVQKSVFVQQGIATESIPHDIDDLSHLV